MEVVEIGMMNEDRLDGTERVKKAGLVLGNYHNTDQQGISVYNSMRGVEVASILDWRVEGKSNLRFGLMCSQISMVQMPMVQSVPPFWAQKSLELLVA